RKSRSVSASGRRSSNTCRSASNRRSASQGVQIVTHTSDMFAPGWPGIPARWTSSAKSGLGTAVSRASRVWFTLSHGILNEIYYPRVDNACTRDLGFIVTDGHAYFSEEKRDAHHETWQLDAGVPCYRVRNTANDGRYR